MGVGSGESGVGSRGGAGVEEADQRRVERSLAGCGHAVSGRIERPHGKDDRLVVRLLWFDGTG